MTDPEREERLAGVDRAVAREMERRRKAVRVYWLLLAVVVVVTLGLVFRATRDRQEAAAERQRLAQLERSFEALPSDVERQVDETIDQRFVDTLEQRVEAVKMEALAVDSAEARELPGRMRETARAFRDFIADRGLEVRSSIPTFVADSPDDQWRYIHGTLMVVHYPVAVGSEVFPRVCDATGAHLLFDRHPGVRGILTRWLHCEFAGNETVWTALTGEAPDLEASCDVGQRPPANEFLEILQALDGRVADRGEGMVTGLVIAAWGEATEEFPDLAGRLVNAVSTYRNGALHAELTATVEALVVERQARGDDVTQTLTQLRRKLRRAAPTLPVDAQVDPER